MTLELDAGKFFCLFVCFGPRYFNDIFIHRILFPKCFKCDYLSGECVLLVQNILSSSVEKMCADKFQCTQFSKKQ